MIAAPNANYKALLKQVIDLRGKGGANAFRRAKILVEVYEQSDFIEQECRGNALDAERKLDDYVQDLCLSFMELRDMLKHFRRSGEWKGGRLKAMHREMLNAKQAARMRQAPKPRPSGLPARERAILAEQESLAAKSRAAYLERRLQSEAVPGAAGSGESVVAVNISPNSPVTTASVARSEPRRGLDLWLAMTDEERRYLIDAPEFQGWCRERGFTIASQRLGLAGH